MLQTSLTKIITPLDEMFKAYCKMDPISLAMNVELLPLSQCDKWFEAAEILDMNRVTSTDTGLCFFKFRKRAINYKEFLEYIKDLANAKDLNINDLKRKLQTSDNQNLLKTNATKENNK